MDLRENSDSSFVVTVFDDEDDLYEALISFADVEPDLNFVVRWEEECFTT